MDDIVKLRTPRPAPPPQPTREEAEAAVRTLIAWAGDDPTREGLIDTPRRVVKAYEELYAGYNERASDALSRVFTEVERRTADRRKQRAPTYAKRFAAKEACAKALGTGVPRRGVHWQDMGVVNLPSGRSTLQLTGGARKRLADLTPAGYEARIDLTITDEGPTAHAFVVISAIPLPGA